jgi:hypothetical protein
MRPIADNYLKYFIREDGSLNSKLDGAFRGKYEGTGDVPGSGEMCMNTRCSSYALTALLKIESDQPDIWLGSNNKKFVDPLTKGKNHKLVW